MTQSLTVGVVTGIVSEQAVEVGGVPRHVRDLRPRDSREETQSSDKGDRANIDEAALWTASEVDECCCQAVRCATGPRSTKA